MPARRRRLRPAAYAEALTPAWPGAIEEAGTVPLVSSRFVGRLRQFWELHSALRSPAVPIITGTTGPAVAKVRGLGGIGKSLLVEEYALRYAAAYPGGVFWLHARGNDDTKGALSTEEREAERNQQSASARTTGGIAPPRCTALRFRLNAVRYYEAASN